MTETNPYFKYAWKVADKLSRLPRQRWTWIIIGVAVAMLTALILSLVLVSQSRPSASRCYAEGTFDGLNIYLQSNRTTMQSCASAAKGSGLTNLSSLPAGVTEVCANGTVTVFMTPVQAATVRSLGLNPASICS